MSHEKESFHHTLPQEADELVSKVFVVTVAGCVLFMMSVIIFVL